MDIESEIAKKMFSEPQDKTYIDKVLNKSDSDKINMILNKSEWSKEDVRSVLYTLNSTELKLGNFDDNERVIILLHFQTLEEISRMMEGYLSFWDDMEKKKKEFETKGTKLDFGESEKELLKKILHQQLLICKGIIDTHCGIIRSAQGLNSQAFKKLTESKYEFSYNQNLKQENVQPKKGLFGI